MATVTRQPFAPLDGVRLQTLTSLKNRQNSISPSSPGKRKASDVVDTDDSENIDPVIFSKRSKGADNSFFPSKDSFIKPASFILTRAASTNDVSVRSTPKATANPRPRSYLNPTSPAKINTGITKSTPLSAPAGRSPTRGKRSGILSSRRRTGGHFRVDPPAFGLPSKSAAPFSLDAALKGTIPSYTSRKASSSLAAPSAPVDVRSLHEPESKASWDFVIHEDTPEQEMTNLLQHSTCVLDISSDEETESRRQRERAEGKENVPPVDDISQTTRTRAARQAAADADAMVFEKERRPLGEMDVREYYSEGCDESSVIIVPGDEDEEPQDQQQRQQPSSNESKPEPEVTPELKAAPIKAAPNSGLDKEAKSVEDIMQKTDDPAPCAAVLEPVEGTGESFEVWESASAKDEAEAEVAVATCST
ncbi:hypothetical protein SLS62_009693 [Diatrype stigma]|uniref:Thymidylate kinase n=1 Tax=Diatrype stigma TaxID=117547 RepID=A0AAN9YJZ1_9PEZI